MLEIINLSKKYGKKEVLKGINLKVNAGEIYGFIGYNGAGKSTTIKSIVGIHTFDKGDILINNKSIKDNPLQCKKEIAYIPDNPDIYENMSAIKYLEFIASIFKMDKEDFKNKVKKLSEEFEMSDKLYDLISTYSHGMKQKLVLISSIMHDPKLLILDEPFVGLDPKASFVLKNKMKELCLKGSSIFFSTHVLEVVEKLCDRVAILNNGEIVVEGRTEEIVNNGKSLEEIFLELE